MRSAPGPRNTLGWPAGRGDRGGLGCAAAGSARRVDGDAGAHPEAAADAGGPTRISAHDQVARQVASKVPGGPGGGGGVKAAAGNGAVGEEDSEAWTTMKRHHEGAASGATGEATGTHVEAGPGRRVDEDRATGTRWAGLANGAVSRMTHEGAPAGTGGPDPSDIGPDAAAVPRGAQRRPRAAVPGAASGSANAGAGPRPMAKSEAAEAKARARALEGRMLKKRRNPLTDVHRSSRSEGVQGKPRTDGDNAAKTSTAQAASRRSIAATEGPGDPDTEDSRRDALASDGNTDAEAFTSAVAARGGADTPRKPARTSTSAQAMEEEDDTLHGGADQHDDGHRSGKAARTKTKKKRKWKARRMREADKHKPNRDEEHTD